MSWKNYLRLGLIFLLTGIIALAHNGLTSSGRLPRGVELIVGIVLVALGLPLLVIAVSKASRR